MKELTEAQWAAFHEFVNELERLDPTARSARFAELCASPVPDPAVVDWVGDWLASPVLHGVADRGRAPLHDIDLPEGGYEILGLLEAGGMGEVYRARDRELDREVAIKVVRPRAGLQDPAAAQRFLREARIVAKLEHPSIVPVHESGRTKDGRVYFVMKLVRGTTLAELVERRDSGAPGAPVVPLRRQVEIVLRLCDALTYAHSRGVLHRDLKPENVMVGEFGEVQLMDWGIARSASAAADEGGGAPQSEGVAATGEGSILGTPAYLSPEQALGKVGAIDVRTDVFGLGAIAYHLFSGRRPYSGRDRDEVIGKAGRGELDDAWFHESKQRVPRELQAICRKALTAERAQRYETIAELACDLEAHVDARPVVAAPPGPLTRAAKLVRRRPAAAAALGLVALFSPMLSYAWFDLQRAAADRSRLRGIELHERIRDAVMVEVGPHDQVAKLRDHSAAARELADAIGEWGVGLEGEDPASDVAARIDQLDAAQRSDVIRAIYSIAKHLTMAGLMHATRLADTAEGSAETAAAYATMRARHPREVALWPRLHPVLSALPDQAIGAHCLVAFERWLLRREELLDLGGERWREAGAEQLNFVAYVVSYLRGPEAAIVILDHALDVAPDDFFNQNERGRVAVLQNDGVTAVRCAAAAMALWPTSRGGLHILAAGYDIVAGQRFDCGDEAGADAALARSIELHRRAVEIAPDFVEGWHNLAIALKHGGQFDEAIEALETERKLAPDDPRIDAAMGDAFEQRSGPGDLEAAEACYRRRIALDPEEWGGHYQLGNLLRHRGDTDEAIRCYREALAGGRGTTQAHAELATMLSLARRPAEAAEVAVARLESKPKDATVEEIRGLAAFAASCLPAIADRKQRAALKRRLDAAGD